MTPELEDAARELTQSIFAEHAADASRLTEEVRSDFNARGMLRSGAYLHSLAKIRADALAEHGLRLVDGLLALALRINPSPEALKDWLHQTAEGFASGQSKALLRELEEQAQFVGSGRSAEVMTAMEPLVATVQNQVSQRVRLRLAETKLKGPAQATPLVMSRADGETARDPRKVAVVYGRNLDAREGVFLLLRALDLRPVEWEDAVQQTGKGSPYNREVVEELFKDTQAVLILLTGDEDVSLRVPFRKGASDGNIRRQARANVLFEAGMAFVANPNRTILVEIGEQTLPSDLDGLNVVRFDGTAQARQRLKERLATAGCKTKTSGTDWLSAGATEFERAKMI